MTIQQRILTIRLMNKMDLNPEYAQKIGLEKISEKNAKKVLTGTTRAGVGSTTRR